MIYPVPKKLIEDNEGVDYILGETKIMRRAGTLKEAEDELLVFIELGGIGK